MKLSTRHSMEKAGVLTHFIGGMDKSRPPEMIDDEALYDATNFYYDPLTGYLTTRPGIKKHSSAALPGGVAVWGTVQYTTPSGTPYTVLAGKDQKLYYLDISKAPVLIGALTGGKRPSFSIMNGLLVISSGAAIQTWDGTTLSTVTSPNWEFIAYYGQGKPNSAIARILAVGDPAFPDRLGLSASLDPTAWTYQLSPEDDPKYIDCGYKDGLRAIAVARLYQDVIVFKRGERSDRRAIYRNVIYNAVDYWQSIGVTDKHTTISPHFVQPFANDLFFIDVEGPKFLSLASDNPEFPFAVNEQDRKISGELASFVNDSGFTIYDPVLGLLMIKPQENSDVFYCLDRLGRRWTYFNFKRNFQSGAYIDGKMLFGATDGYVYEFDWESDTDDGDLPIRSFETKWFDIEAMYRNMAKEKYLDAVGITNGSLTLSIKNRGEIIYSKSLNFDEAWWDWALVDLLTPEEWTEQLSKTKAKTLYDRNRVDADKISFVVTVPSGLCSVVQLGARIATVGRK